MIDINNNLILEQQISNFSNKQVKVEDVENDVLDNADLKVQTKRYSELQNKVKEFVRKNSLQKEAK